MRNLELEGDVENLKSTAESLRGQLEKEKKENIKVRIEWSKLKNEKTKATMATDSVDQMISSAYRTRRYGQQEEIITALKEEVDKLKAELVQRQESRRTSLSVSDVWLHSQ